MSPNFLHYMEDVKVRLSHKAFYFLLFALTSSRYIDSSRLNCQSVSNEISLLLTAPSQLSLHVNLTVVILKDILMKNEGSENASNPPLLPNDE